MCAWGVWECESVCVGACMRARAGAYTRVRARVRGVCVFSARGCLGVCGSDANATCTTTFSADSDARARTVPGTVQHTGRSALGLQAGTEDGSDARGTVPPAHASTVREAKLLRGRELLLERCDR